MNEFGRWRWSVLFWAPLAYFRGVVLNLWEAVQRWYEDDAGLLAAGVAYYMTVSLFPLLVVMIAGLGLFMQFTNLGHNAEHSILMAIAQTTSPAVAEQVSAVFKQVQRQALISGPLGIFGAVLASIAVFSRFDRALDRIWDVPPPPVNGLLGAAALAARRRLRACVILLSLGFVVVVIFGSVMGLAAAHHQLSQWLPIAPWAWQVAEVVLSVGLNTLVFTAIFRWLAKVPVAWPKAARGGLLSALAWELGRLLLAALLIGSRYSAYGVVGSLLAVMLWMYYAASVLLLGAEYVQVIRLRDRVTRPAAPPAPAPLESDMPLRQLDDAFARWRRSRS